MKTIDAAALHALIENFVTERDWDQFHSVKNLSVALSVEASELAEIFQWMKEEDSNQVRSDAVLQEKVRDELADIFFFLLRLSQKTGVNLEEALKEKLKKNEAKYPADKVRGSSRKYTDY